MESQPTTTWPARSPRRSAREADELGAPAEMLVHPERALKLWSAVENREQVSGVDELQVTKWAARAAGASGEPDRAIVHSRSAIELADTRGDAMEPAEVRRTCAQYLFTLDGTAQRAYDTAHEAWQLVAQTRSTPGWHGQRAPG